MIQLSLSEQILKSHLHEQDQIFFRASRLCENSAVRAIQHVVRGVGHGPKATPLDQDRFFMKHFSGLYRLAVRREHHRARQTLTD